MNEHVSGEILAAYIDNRLERGQKPGVEAHLCRCRECRQALAEVAGMLANREKVPAEFLRQGLRVSGTGDSGRQEIPEKSSLLLRPAFGVAAVFLVVVLAGFFFLGRGRMQRPRTLDRELPEQSVVKDEAPGAVRDENVPAAVAALEKAVVAQSDADRVAAGGQELKNQLAAETPNPVALAAAPIAAPGERELPREADKTEPAWNNDVEGGGSGGVLDDVDAPAAKGRGEEMKMVLAKKTPSFPARGGTTLAAAQRMRSVARLDAVSGALQLFLATSGRAAAPLTLGMMELAAGPPVRIEGDVTGGDLLAPGLHDVWGWLPEGSALKVTIGRDGRVTAVELLGEWESWAAARAKTAAGMLRFSSSQQETRRVVLSREFLI